MLSTSILGAISTVLLLNPHLALGAHLGSLGTHVSPHQQGTLPSIEAPLLKRAQESSSAPSGSAAVDAALDEIFSHYKRIHLLKLLHHYETNPELKEGIRDIMTSEYNPSYKVKEELVAAALKYAIKELWRLSEGGDVPVADLDDIFDTLQLEVWRDGGITTLLEKYTRSEKELFAKNAIYLMGLKNFERYFQYIAKYISTLRDRDHLLVAYSEQHGFTSEFYERRINNLEDVNKLNLVVNFLPDLPKAKFDYLFASIVNDHIPFPATSGGRMFQKVLSYNYSEPDSYFRQQFSVYKY